MVLTPKEFSSVLGYSVEKQAEVELITCIVKRYVDDELKVDKKHDLKKIKG